MGQQQQIGNYPVHFHLCGDVDEKGGYTFKTYLEGLSIHHCFSRCVTVHGTNGLLVGAQRIKQIYKEHLDTKTVPSLLQIQCSAMVFLFQWINKLLQTVI